MPSPASCACRATRSAREAGEAADKIDRLTSIDLLWRARPFLPDTATSGSALVAAALLLAAAMWVRRYRDETA